MANYPAGFVPGGAIRVPNVYPGFQNGSRLAVRPSHLTMTQNGMVQGVHHNNINANYVPNMIAMNNMVNNPRFVNQMQMRMQPPFKQPSSIIGKLLQFVEVLGCEVMINLQNIQYWKTVTNSFFSEDVTMKYTLVDEMKQKTRRFELPYQVIPRFYQTFFESGVAKIQLILGNPRERNINTTNGVQFQVDCMSASIEYHFANGIQVTAPGRLMVTFNNTFKMTNFDFVTSNFTEYVPRNLIPNFTSDTVVVNEYGIPFKTMRCIEIAEGVGYMQDVMALTIKDSQIGPLQALRMVHHSQNMNLTPTISNNPNPNQRIQNSQGKKVVKNEPNYNAPPTPNSNELQAAPTPVATPTPVPTPTPTPSLTPSPLVANANGIAVGSPRQKLPTKSPALSEQSLKRGNDGGSLGKQKRRSIQKNNKNA